MSMMKLLKHHTDPSIFGGVFFGFFSVVFTFSGELLSKRLYGPWLYVGEGEWTLVPYPSYFIDSW